jgi:hypothetical protein
MSSRLKMGMLESVREGAFFFENLDLFFLPFLRGPQHQDGQAALLLALPLKTGSYP